VPRLNLECVSMQKPDSLVAVGIGDLYLLHKEREVDLVRAVTTADRDFQASLESRHTEQGRINEQDRML
jgi:hypothetical protein